MPDWPHTPGFAPHGGEPARPVVARPRAVHLRAQARRGGPFVRFIREELAPRSLNTLIPAGGFQLPIHKPARTGQSFRAVANGREEAGRVSEPTIFV